MNERIKELMIKAGINVDALKMYVGGFPREDLLVLEDFAELIVQECVKAADEWYQYHNEIQWDPGEHIKQHFGVE
jgi:hypothetical protein